MSYNIFLASDHHMNHANCLTFKKNDGTPLRPYSCVEEMNETLIDNHNSVVRPQDKIYMLGDVAMNKRGLEMVKRMNGTKILIKGNHDCLDNKTECLTKRGWVHHSNITVSDEVFSVNPKTNLGEWKPIMAQVSKPYTGNMWNLETERFSMSVTDNHRIRFKRNTTSEAKYCTPSELKGKAVFDTAAILDCPEYNISDVYLKLLAWFYTDGCFSKHKGENRSVAFYQSKVSGMQRLESILNSVGMHFTKSSEGVTPKGTEICGKKLVKDSLEAFVYRVPVKSCEKFLGMLHEDRHTLPEWIYSLSERQAKVFIEELVDGDGSWASNGLGNAACLYGMKKFLDQVQILCITKGISASISVFRDNDFRLNINFGSRSKTYNIYRCAEEGTWRKDFTSGTVWCIETEYTNFMVRRDGKPFFTGNCESLSKYAEIFKDVRAVHPLEKGFVLTHVPLHPDCLERWGVNVHGHLHSNRVKMQSNDVRGLAYEVDNPKYFCACVEQINFTPIAFEEIKRIVRERA